MQSWWWRSVAACSAVAAAAGLVTVVAGASAADRSAAAGRAAAETRAAITAGTERTGEPAADRPGGDAGDAAAGVPAPADPSPAAQVDPARPVPPRRPAAPADRGRVADGPTGSTLALPPGWREVPAQSVVPAPPGRFGTTLVLPARAVVLLGPLAPALAETPAEATRLASAFAAGTGRGATRFTDLGVRRDTVDGRAAWTALRRIEGGERRTAGALVRVSTVDAAPGQRQGAVLVAVALAGPSQPADARAADLVVRSLRPAAPERPAPDRDARPAPPGDAAPVSAPRPAPPREEPARPAPRPAPPTGP